MGGDGRRDGWKGGGGQKRKYGSDLTGGRRHVFKILCPESLITSVMGPRGATKDQIQEETSCKLVFSNRDEYFPGTHYRTLCIYSDEPEAIVSVLDRVVDRLVECGEHERLSSRGEGDFRGKESGEYVVRALISGKMSGAVIGTKGSNVQAIRHENNARVFIEKPQYNGHQMMRVIAVPEGLRTALARINECIQTETDNDDFSQWASIRSFSDEDCGSGKAKGGKSSGKGSSRGSSGGRAERSRHEERDSQWQQPQHWDSSNGGWHEWDGGYDAEADTPASDIDPSIVQALAATVMEFPPGTIEQECTLTCEMPVQKVPYMLGKTGEHVQLVGETTGARIHFEEPQSADDEQQTLVIHGPLLRAYQAHALMMKRYHEAEAEATAEPEAPSVQQLQQQLADLQEQLAKVQSQVVSSSGWNAGSWGWGKAKGKGKKG